MRAWIGRSVLVIGVMHIVFGFVIFGDVLAPSLCLLLDSGFSLCRG